ncbi:flagellin [Brevundimonas naejangsanensis]|uniref:flagellin n=1 Tax=Brevundimonas naejangsanensis TaxID=588932 RepID=UPI00320AE3B3
MANSINTNVGALVALQNLNATNAALNKTQNRVNTGFNVATAKDNGAIFAIATNQRADMAALDSVKQSIQRGQSIVDVALAAGDTVVAALTEMKSLAVAIEGFGDTPPDDNPSYDAYVADYNALKQEITDALAGATFDGVNLFTAEASGTDQPKVRTGLGAASEFSFGFDTVWADLDLDEMTADDVQAAITSFTTSLATLGTQSKSMDRQLTFANKLQDALETGVGNLVDADLAKESARLTALQTKQQLGVQALSIANQSSSILLGLFR